MLLQSRPDLNLRWEFLWEVIGSDDSALVYLLWLMVSPALTAVNGSPQQVSIQQLPPAG